MLMIGILGNNVTNTSKVSIVLLLVDAVVNCYGLLVFL